MRARERTMRISPIGNLDVVGAAKAKVDVKESSDPAASFKDMVKHAAAEVNRLQSEADTAAVATATGDLEDVHRATIAMQKAKLALDLTIQVRNKVIEAYQEIMRMQV
jgi:flagellar hook-basal body complex protein FliE